MRRLDWVRAAGALREAPLHPVFKIAYAPIIERFSRPARASRRGRRRLRRGFGMQLHTFVYICIPNTTTTAKPTQTQPQPSPDPNPVSETPSHSKTNPSSQPERKRRGVVENVENPAVRRFRGLNASFFTFSTN